MSKDRKLLREVERVLGDLKIKDLSSTPLITLYADLRNHLGMEPLDVSFIEDLRRITQRSARGSAKRA